MQLQGEKEDFRLGGSRRGRLPAGQTRGTFTVDCMLSEVNYSKVWVFPARPGLGARDSYLAIVMVAACYRPHGGVLSIVEHTNNDGHASLNQPRRIWRPIARSMQTPAAESHSKRQQGFRQCELRGQHVKARVSKYYKVVGRMTYLAPGTVIEQSTVLWTGNGQI